MKLELNNQELSLKTDQQKANDEKLLSKITSLLPQFGPNWHRHSLIGMKVQTLSRVLYYSQLYEKIVDVPGVICEFGVQWGATMVELTNLRGIYEPFNISRKIIGFDSFSGFPSLSEHDENKKNQWNVGDYSSKSQYEHDLEEILTLHEGNMPYSHIKKFELVKGDISITFKEW